MCACVPHACVRACVLARVLAGAQWCIPTCPACSLRPSILTRFPSGISLCHGLRLRLARKEGERQAGRQERDTRWRWRRAGCVCLYSLGRLGKAVTPAPATRTLTRTCTGAHAHAHTHTKTQTKMGRATADYALPPPYPADVSLYRDSHRPLILPADITLKLQLTPNSRAPAWVAFDG